MFVVCSFVRTVVGEMALHIAFQQPGKTGIYTTPLKALSNQKYSEMATIFGRPNTGLSTGDVSINKGARVTIMTTEVYRNIAWRSSTPSPTNSMVVGGKYTDELIDNAVVVLDEFHYMGNPGRGGVWEESVITSPSHTQIIGLSATLSNAQSLSQWMESVTGRRTILVEVPASKRPVPLRYLFATKEGLYPLFRDPDAGPGSPKGLLGYRGDGESSANTQSKGGRGFVVENREEEITSTRQKLPRGLHVNPALRDAAARRQQKIDRAIDRQKSHSRRGPSIDNNEWDDPNPRQQLYKSSKKLNAKEERKERERLLKKEMRRAVPSMHALVTRLDQKNMLPAIFFIFSRAGCDEAARMVSRYMKGQQDRDASIFEEFGENGDDSNRKTRRQQDSTRKSLIKDSNGRAFRPGSNYANDDLILSTFYDTPDSSVQEVKFNESVPILASKNWDYYAKVGLLSYAAISDVAVKISMFNKENDEIAFDDELIGQYLLGVGSHHAGMLPAHKSFVEGLFRNQQMKVVFATETLAAGINMPARTTVICSMAKKGNGGSAMNLLETSNLLQMAGRAGRRGMDTDGTCVIVATPFESHDDAAKILTDAIAPISSQFSPSYSLCVNLIARGDGELTVARQLVSKSFAMWERRRAEEDMESIGIESGNMQETLQSFNQDKFLNAVINAFQSTVDEAKKGSSVTELQNCLSILNDQKILKKASKSYVGTATMLKLESTTLGYLEKELAASKQVSANSRGDVDDEEDLIENEDDLRKQIDIQRQRAVITEREVVLHPFTAIATAATNIMEEGTPTSRRLTELLRVARGSEADDLAPCLLSPEELSTFAKSAVMMRRKSKKIAMANPGLSAESILEDIVDDTSENSWDDFLSILRSLVAYGCLTRKSTLSVESNLEAEKFELTTAGLHIGLLGFENSLWALAAMGGAWDVAGASYKLDEFRNAMRSFEENDDNASVWGDVRERETGNASAKRQEEADSLVMLLKRMTPSEIAGYVSSLISDDSRGGGPSVVELFQRVTPLQQQVVQKSLLCLERLVEVQKINLVDETTRSCNLYATKCFVL